MKFLSLTKTRFETGVNWFHPFSWLLLQLLALRGWRKLAWKRDHFLIFPVPQQSWLWNLLLATRYLVALIVHMGVDFRLKVTQINLAFLLKFPGFSCKCELILDFLSDLLNWNNFYGDRLGDFLEVYTFLYIRIWTWAWALLHWSISS